MKKLLFIALVSLSTSAFADKISRNNEVQWIAASSVASSNSHFIQWKNTLEEVSDCASNNGSVRTRISTEDKALFSLLLTAYSSNKKVSFFYKTTPDTGSVPGHGTTCQIVNAWLEK